MKRLLSTLLALCLLIGATPTAYATQETIPVVTTWNELQRAMSTAKDGDTIILADCQIEIPNGTFLGDLEKHLILQLSEQVKYESSILSLQEGDKTTEIHNITFDGNNVQISSMIHSWSNVLIDDCTFIDCNCINDASLITTDQSHIDIRNCSFTNVHANNCGLCYVSENDFLEVTNCSFENLSGNMCSIIQNSGTTILHANHYIGNMTANNTILNEGTLYLDIDVSHYSKYYNYEPYGWYITATYNGATYVPLAQRAKLELTYIDQQCTLVFDNGNPNPQSSLPQPQPQPQPQQQPVIPPADEDNKDDTTPPVDEVEVPLQNHILKCGYAEIDTTRKVVLAGYGDGLLHENDSLTRAQMSQIIMRLLTEDSARQLRTKVNNFADVSVYAWYNEAVSTIAKAGIVEGCGNGLFCPDDTLTWAQIITIMTRFVEPQSCRIEHIQYKGWAEQALQTAVALGWIEDSPTVIPDAIITRGQLTDFLNYILSLY